MHSFVKLFSILSSRGTTNTFCKNKTVVVVVFVVRATREKFRCDLQQRGGESFLRFFFFFCDVGAFYPFFFRRKTSRERFEIFEEGATRREKKCGRYDANARRLLAFKSALLIIVVLKPHHLRCYRSLLVLLLVLLLLLSAL